MNLPNVRGILARRACSHHMLRKCAIWLVHNAACHADVVLALNTLRLVKGV